MATCKVILMAKVTSSDGLMVVNTDDNGDQIRRSHGRYTDDKCDQFRLPSSSQY